jgi:hypothetical protein
MPPTTDTSASTHDPGSGLRLLPTRHAEDAPRLSGDDHAPRQPATRSAVTRTGGRLPTDTDIALEEPWVVGGRSRWMGRIGTYQRGQDRRWCCCTALATTSATGPMCCRGGAFTKSSPPTCPVGAEQARRRSTNRQPAWPASSSASWMPSGSIARQWRELAGRAGRPAVALWSPSGSAPGVPGGANGARAGGRVVGRPTRSTSAPPRFAEGPHPTPLGRASQPPPPWPAPAPRPERCS